MPPEDGTPETTGVETPIVPTPVTIPVKEPAAEEAAEFNPVDEYASLSDDAIDDEMGEDDDEGEEEETAAEAGAEETPAEGDTPTEPTAEAEPSTSPEEVVQPVQAAPPAPAPEEVVTDPSAVAQAPTPAPVPQQTPEEVAAAYNNWRQNTEATLATQFSVSDELAQQFDENPQEALPRLAASVCVTAMERSLLAMTQSLPSMVNSVIASNRVAEEGEKSFFEAWPQLNMETDGDVIRSIGQAYRQHSPNASAEEFINIVGASAMVALKRSPGEAASPTAPTPPAPKPFTPAGGGGTTPRPKNTPTNQFTQLADEFEEEDASGFG